MPDSADFPSLVYGVDFSGAADAGKRVWIAHGLIEGEGLRIEDCHPAEALPGSGRSRDRCLSALRDFIARQGASVFGLDFSFGLPLPLMGQSSWEGFVRSFSDGYASPEALREACRAAAGGRELKRVTDLESKTPFSPYNLRLFRQTYFGIRDVLSPLALRGLACVLPMQRALPGRPWLLEVCPAATLKAMDLYIPYKGPGKERRAARGRILEEIEKGVPLFLPQPGLLSVIAGDPDGDALDSVVAASAAFRAIRRPDGLVPKGHAAYALEGYVYV